MSLFRRAAVASAALVVAVIGAPTQASAAPIPMPSACPSGYLCVWDWRLYPPPTNPTWKTHVYFVCSAWGGGTGARELANHTNSTVYVYDGNNCRGTRGTIYPQTANDNMGYWTDHIRTFITSAP